MQNTARSSADKSCFPCSVVKTILIPHIIIKTGIKNLPPLIFIVYNSTIRSFPGGVRNNLAFCSIAINHFQFQQKFGMMKPLGNISIPPGICHKIPSVPKYASYRIFALSKEIAYIICIVIYPRVIFRYGSKHYIICYTLSV